MLDNVVQTHLVQDWQSIVTNFLQAASGISCEIPLNMKVICYKCDGTRSEMGYRGNVCPYCEGTGIETVKVTFCFTDLSFEVSGFTHQTGTKCGSMRG